MNGILLLLHIFNYVIIFVHAMNGREHTYTYMKAVVVSIRLSHASSSLVASSVPATTFSCIPKEQRIPLFDCTVELPCKLQVVPR